MEKTMDVFVKSQADADERFQMREDVRWMKEMELEENQRREDRQHQLQMMQSRSYPPQSYGFD